MVINRVRSENDLTKVRALIAGYEDLFTDQFALPYDEQLIECEPGVEPLLSAPAASPFVEGVRTLRSELLRAGIK
jgi:hypothetical protein